MEGEDEGEGEEAEGDKILKEVLDEIGMNMNDAVSRPSSCFNVSDGSSRTYRSSLLPRPRIHWATNLLPHRESPWQRVYPRHLRRQQVAPQLVEGEDR